MAMVGSGAIDVVGGGAPGNEDLAAQGAAAVTPQLVWAHALLVQAGYCARAYARPSSPTAPRRPSHQPPQCRTNRGAGSIRLPFRRRLIYGALRTAG
jgi:hypothetical protein